LPGSRKTFDPTRNKLLAALPKKELQRLGTWLEPVALKFDDVLFDAGAPIRHVYFPTSGMISLLLLLEDGPMAEVARVGNEGMVGLPVFLGVKTSHTRALVQIPGEALRIKLHHFRELTRAGGPLSNVLLRYAQALINHTEQLTACNTWHMVEQRLCRWLLITQHRVQADTIQVTQEFLSQMLGAHRQSVTLAASNLQRSGLIRYSRGKLRILDRPGLEEASCGCDRAIQRQFEELLAAIR
jgi:CRP-like cAMP-binding protein